MSLRSKASTVLALWRCKWGVLRLLVAAFLLWVLATDTGARMARLQLAALPGFDYVQEVQSLRAQGRYGEAVMVAEAGLNDAKGMDHARLVEERAKTIQEQDSYLRKAKALALGAVSGQADSLEGLIGAVAADFFVVGDVRDLVIQGGKQMLDGDSDEVVLLLSVVGVVTTLAPEVDWVPSVVKAARKSGALTVRMAEYLKSAIKGKRVAELDKVFGDVEKIAKKASPGGAMHLMRLAEEPKDLERLAAFVDKTGEGAFALHVTGKEGAELLKAGEAGEELLIKAAKKGKAGSAFLRSPAARALAKPHFIVGVLKGLWKGNVAKLVSRAMERLDPAAWWVLPLLAGWVVVEAALVSGKFRARAHAVAGTITPRREAA
jgi:hypothetical protein